MPAHRVVGSALKTAVRAVTLGGLVSMPLLIASFAVAQEEPLRRDPTLVERGRYLVETIGFCGGCHTTRGPDGRLLPDMNQAGGRIIAERGFRAVAPNITPDPETGIGRWSDSDVAVAIREGRRPDGSMIGPPMPIELYRGLSDRDLSAMVAYLRAIPPIRNAVTQRSAYPVAPTSFGPPVSGVPDPSDDPVARGAYLAGPVGHCTYCHTPELSNDRRDWSRIGAGGVRFEGPWGVVPASNITSDKERGIGNWTDEQILRALTQGVSADGRRLAPPMGGRAPVYARMAERDLRDLVAYLRTIPPQK